MQPACLLMVILRQQRIEVTNLMLSRGCEHISELKVFKIGPKKALSKLYLELFFGLTSVGLPVS